jgi:integrase
MKRKRGKGADMNALQIRAENSIKEMAAAFAGFPSLDKWTPEMKAQAKQFAVLLNTANKIIAAAEINGIDYGAKKETFLARTNSEHTRRAYASALDRLEAWANRKEINPLELSAADADRFIHDMKAADKAAATTRRNIAAVSAFYSFLERETDGKVKNPVRGTKQRPPKEESEIIIPTEKDYKTVIAELPPVERAIVIVMATRGLRAGALPTLEQKGEKYIGKSKGKRLEENSAAGITLPPEALEAIRAAELDIKKPFAWQTKQGNPNSANAIECRVNFQIAKIYNAGLIRCRYSCHDFRHYFAVQEYKKNKDIFRLSKLLNHAGIQVTQTYLRSIGIEM